MKRLLNILLVLLCMDAAAQNYTQGGTRTMQKKYPMLTYQELKQFATPDEAAWKGVRGVGAVWGETGTDYPEVSAPPVKGRRSMTLSARKGDRVCAQAVIYSAEKVKDISFEIEGFDALGDFEAGFVREVLISSASDSLMVPDCIDTHLTYTNMEAMTVQPVWISFNIPSDARAGVCSGKVLIRCRADVVAVLDLKIKVRDEVSRPLSMPAGMNLFQNPYSVARYYHQAEWIPGYLTPWTPQHYDAMRPLMQRLASVGQKDISASIVSDPVHAVSEDPMQTMVSWVRRLDGTWDFYFDIFDSWVEFMISSGIDGTITCYSLGSEISYLNVRNFRMGTMTPSDPSFCSAVSSFISAFAEHLRSKGWLEKTGIVVTEGLEWIEDVLEANGLDVAEPASANWCSWPLEPLMDARYLPAEEFISSDRPDSKPGVAGQGTGNVTSREFVRTGGRTLADSPLFGPFLIYPGNRPSVRYERMVQDLQNRLP